MHAYNVYRSNVHCTCSDPSQSTWSTDNVTTVSVTEDKERRVYEIVCESNHFTAFAVLMDVTGALNVRI